MIIRFLRNSNFEGINFVTLELNQIDSIEIQFENNENEVIVFFLSPSLLLIVFDRNQNYYSSNLV